jgi:oxalate decarboxylase/phosphoglucose isomerase-like protein (cupin superfamily)
MYTHTQGTVEVGVFTKPGEFDTAIIGPGDLGAAPRGSGHYLRNIGEDDAHVVLIFNAGREYELEYELTLPACGGDLSAGCSRCCSLPAVR